MDGQPNIRWIRTPGCKILLVERVIKVKGEVEILIDGRRQWIRPNGMLKGMGEIYAYASRTGTCNQISGMGGVHGAGGILFSVPVRTAGGQGATDDLTVQSTWTNTSGGAITLVKFWVWTPGFGGSGRLDLATIDDSVTVPDAAMLAVNWTIQIPSTTCHFEDAQRYDMAEGISPEALHGGALYKYTHVKFVWAAGDSGLQVVTDSEGGTGYDQKLATTGQYLHAGADVIVTEAEVYNSNGDLVDEIVGLAEPLANAETMQVIYTTTYQGT